MLGLEFLNRNPSWDSSANAWWLMHTPKWASSGGLDAQTTSEQHRKQTNLCRKKNKFPKHTRGC